MSKELFELNSYDLTSSLDRIPSPIGLKNFTYFPAKISYQNVDTYNNPWNKWTNRATLGFFSATTNLVQQPEDLAASPWAAASCTAVASNYYWNNKRFTLLTASAVTGNMAQQPTVTTAVYSASIVMMRGTTIVSRLLIRDAGGSARIDFNVNWSTNTVAASTGTLVFANWYGTDIVEIGGYAASAFSSVTGDVVVIADNSTAYKSCYFTAVKLELGIYPRPYAMEGGATNFLIYQMDSIPTEGSIECWVRPWFTYNGAGYYKIFSDEKGGGGWGVDTWFQLYYDNAVDKFTWSIKPTSTLVTLTFGCNSSGTWGDVAFTTSTILQSWWHLKTVWSVATPFMKVYVNGNLIVSNTTSLSGFTGISSKLFSIGNTAYSGGVNAFDGQITDFCISNTADINNSHYRRNRPYYSSKRMFGEDTKWRLP